MTRTTPLLYALDTNVYIDALRNRAALAGLKQFLLRRGTRVRLASVVAMELRAGAMSREQIQAVDQFTGPYLDRELVIVPSAVAYVEAGRVLAALREGGTIPRGNELTGLTNDSLLAASCRESGAELVTSNSRDFAMLKRELRGFSFSAPEWPAR